MNLEDIIITEITDVVTVEQKQGTSMNIDKRKSYALSFCTSGKITYSHKGKTYYSDKNKVIFHPKNESYNLFCTESGEFPLIEFEIANQGFNDFIQIDVPTFMPFLPIYEQIRKNLCQPNKRIKNLSLVYEILDMLLPSLKSNVNPILSPALKVLFSSFTDSELSVNKLAELSHVSECYFRRLFIEAFGISPKRYLREQRLRYAKQLLKDSTKTITEIAFESGFSSVYYFSKVFKEQENITANEYLRLNKHRKQL